jgi:hypothetical protein
MELTGREIRHSMVLAWLLDWDMTSYGTHAQGNRGFQLFLEEFGLPAEYATGRYHVAREKSGNEARIDVEIAERQKFLIHIENKIWSAEGQNETDREWGDIQRRADELQCPAERCHALYLTPRGQKAQNPNFKAVSWRQMARVFKKFGTEAKAKDVRLFARHYVKVLESRIIYQTISEEDESDVE